MATPGVAVRTWTARGVLASALLGETGLVWFGLNGTLHGRILLLELMCLALFAGAVPALALARLGTRTGWLLVIGVGVLLQCAAVSAPPTSSDDVNRYAFDAKVQLAGIDPYRYAPNAPQLAKLRDEPLFYRGSDCRWPLGDGVCSAVNRPGVHTIYPPIAEAAFTATRLADGARGDGPQPFQVLAGLCAVGVSLLLARAAAGAGRAAWTVALWSWCPVTVFELGNNAHVDGLATLLSVGGLLAATSRQRGWRAGGLIGAAAAVKLYPAVLLTVLLRRHPFKVLAGAAAVVGVAYLPHVVAVGGSVIGYLPGYLKEEDYTDGSRFGLLGVIAPTAVLAPLAVAVLVVGAVVAVRRADPARPEQTAVWLVGLTLLVSTPSYSWYALLLLALVAMTGRVEWLALCVMPTVSMLSASDVHYSATFRTSCYAVALFAVMIGELVRHFPLVRLRRSQSHRNRQLSQARAR